MTDTARSTGATGTATSPVRARIDWRRAGTALRGLVAHPDRTDYVFEIIAASAGPSGERLYGELVRDAGGQRLLLAHPSLQHALSDRASLAAMPTGSLGAAYLEFMQTEQLDPRGLEQAADQVESRGNEVDPERRWFFDRVRDMHDLWHVLTGYGRDEAGELANLAFTYAQLRNRGIGLIVLAGAMLGPKGEGFGWQRYLYRAYARGKASGRLPFAAYEELLPRPLDEVRSELGIPPAETAHPGGIIVASRSD